jgi:membrane protease YdiL (CAAX protease family)
MENHRLAIQLPEKGMKVLRFPLIRLVIAILFFLAFISLARALDTWITGDLIPAAGSQMKESLRLGLYCALTWAGYALYCATIEGRRVSELDPHKGFVQTIYGLLLGFGFISLIILIMWLTGCYHVSGIRSVSVLLPVVYMAVQAGIVEEIVSRGIIFRIAEEGMGTWLSVLFSAFLFGLGHIANPNATLISSVSIAITAGVILAMLYVITRQLWIPIGLHIGWNFTLGGIYGAPVSGLNFDGILNATFSGPEWMTGGAFGPEASVITVIVFVIFGAFLIRKSIIDKSWVKPLWRAKNDSD